MNTCFRCGKQTSPGVTDCGCEKLTEFELSQIREALSGLQKSLKELIAINEEHFAAMTAIAKRWKELAARPMFHAYLSVISRATDPGTLAGYLADAENDTTLTHEEKEEIKTQIAARYLVIRPTPAENQFPQGRW